MNFGTFFSEHYGELLITLVALPVSGLLYSLSSWYLSGLLRKEALKKQVKAKKVLVTGASKGLGLSIAQELVRQGAHVTICARGSISNGKNSLELVVEQLKALKVTPDQQIHYLALDLTKYTLVYETLEKFVESHGMFDWVINSAGTAVPQFLVDQHSLQKGDTEWQMEANYYSAMFTTRALLKIATKSDPIQEAIIPSRFVFVGSVMSTLAFIGFTGYAASKYALRGFCEALRSELVGLSSVHLYLPGNMDTPGFEHENQTKPKISKDIEGTSTLVSPDAAAQFLLAGIVNERYQISNDILGELARISVNGGTPRPNLIAEMLCSPLLALIFSVWAFATDLQIKSYYKKK
ncbi:hypothetical protein EDD86DRAFT_196000 [Gorgonomyces haynaldii]|nr:hypothetical protein EDD86DRAFT_196000 [Gorgonomyces haynaldii]